MVNAVRSKKLLKVYKENGLPFYNELFIKQRDYHVDVITMLLKHKLREQNRAWSFKRIEAPLLVPESSYVSNSYERDDIFQVSGDFRLRPETTTSSYEFANYLLEHQRFVPPLCVWQYGKSFRRENDQVSANVRLKEFYQLEFQCIVTEDTKNNYQETILPDLEQMINKLTGLQTRIIESDRLPKYSKKTMDIEVKTAHKWLEVMSCSIRTDVPFQWNDKKLINYEFAFGVDRLVYAQ